MEKDYASSDPCHLHADLFWVMVTLTLNMTASEDFFVSCRRQMLDRGWAGICLRHPCPLFRASHSELLLDHQELLQVLSSFPSPP